MAYEIITKTGEVYYELESPEDLRELVKLIFLDKFKYLETKK